MFLKKNRQTEDWKREKQKSKKKKNSILSSRNKTQRETFL